MVGLSKEQVLSCMGAPASKAAEGATEVWGATVRKFPADCLRPRRGHACGGALGFLAIVFTDDATPCRKALGRMVLHPRGELRRANQAGLHRDVGEIRSSDDLLVATCRRGETAEHGDDLDHDRPPSLR